MVTKKKISILLLILLIISLVFLATSCDFLGEIQEKEPTVSAISVKNITKVEYTVGDKLDITGAKVVAVYTDEEVKEFDLTMDMVDISLDMNVVGENIPVIINYLGKSTSFNITIKKSDIVSAELLTTPYKLNYIEGQKIEVAGATIETISKQGKKSTIAVLEEYLESYSTKPGERTITIKYAGLVLNFDVTFMKKSLIKFEILTPPSQTIIHLNAGSTIDTTKMRIKLVYDNGDYSIYENAVLDVERDYTQEVVDKLVAEWKSYVEPRLSFYIKDDVTNDNAVAKVIFDEGDVEDKVTYKYNKTPSVSEGDIVDVNTILATNKNTDETYSKTQGVVEEITEDSIVISRIVEHQCTVFDYSDGEIVLKNNPIGRYAGEIVESEVSGFIHSQNSDKRYIKAMPTASFRVSVKDKTFERMEILDYPQSQKGMDIDEIIQGDNLNLSTGKVKIIYSDKSFEILSMNDTRIRVINAPIKYPNEIPGITIDYNEIYDEVDKGVYTLPHIINFSNEAPSRDNLTITTRVYNEEGDLQVGKDNDVTLAEGKYYDVSVLLEYKKAQSKLLQTTQVVYRIYTVGAQKEQARLNLDDAGEYTLRVIFDGVSSNFVEMNTTIISKVPVSISLFNDTISGKTFYRGDVISLAKITYKLNYNNGETDLKETSVDKNMVEGDLLCSQIGENQKLYFVHKYRIEGEDFDREVRVELPYNVIERKVSNVVMEKYPTKPYLTDIGNGSAGSTIGVNNIDLSGSIIAVTFVNGAVKLVSENFDTLISNGQNIIKTYPCIIISYNDSDTAELTPENIYNNSASYQATLQYCETEEDLNQGDNTINLNYYIINEDNMVRTVTGIVTTDKVKTNYVRNEDIDFSGIELSVEYTNGLTQRIPASKIYLEDKNITSEIGESIVVRMGYLGVYETNPVLKINVEERKEQELFIRKDGKYNYITRDDGVDFTEFQFVITHNAGANLVVSQLTDIKLSKIGNLELGWWYYLTEENEDGEWEEAIFGTAGTKRVTLNHTTELYDGSTNTISIEFLITVTIDVSEVHSIKFVANENTEIIDGYYVLEEVPKGRPLRLYDYDSENKVLVPKQIEVVYEADLDTPYYIDITSQMLNYSQNDLTVTNFLATLTYNNKSIKLYLKIVNVTLNSIKVEKTPNTNFIANSNLESKGGILKCEYQYTNSVRTVDIYIDMESSDVTLSGFNSKINESVPFVSQSISVSYENAKTSFDISVYNKLDLTFIYQNTIFFYGLAKPALVDYVNKIEGFELPTEKEIYYVCSAGFSDVITETHNTPIKVKDNNDNIITYYINMSDSKNVRSEDNRFVSPAPYKKNTTIREDYYIMVKVGGNDYYNSGNYAYSKYTIIPKTVNLEYLESDYNAYVLRFEEEKQVISKAVEGLNVTDSQGNSELLTIKEYYQNKEDSENFSKGFVKDIIIASINSSYFEVIIYFDETKVKVNKTIKQGIDEVYNTIIDKVRYIVNIDSDEGVEIETKVDDAVRGVNYAFKTNNIKNYKVSYYIPYGLMLKNGGLLEVLEGALSPETNNVGENIISMGDLSHINYTLVVLNKDSSFIIVDSVDELIVENLDSTNTVTIAVGEDLSVKIVKNSVESQLDTNLLEFSLSQSFEEVIELPVTIGTYYVRVKPYLYDATGVYSKEFILKIE